MRNITISFIITIATLFVSCGNKTHKEQQVVEYKPPLEQWRDSISKMEQMLSFNGDTVGITTFKGYKGEQKSDMTSAKYAEDGETKIETNIHRTYYLYDGKVYEIVIKTDNKEVFDLIVNTYKERYNYPENTEEKSPTFIFKHTRIDTWLSENESMIQDYDGTWYPNKNYNSDFKSGYIYCISYTDTKLRDAYKQHEEAEEKRLEEEYEVKQEKKDRATDSIKKELKNQF